MLKITAVEHDGLPAVELVAGGTRLVVVHAIGPRIAWFGAVGSDNLLFWDFARRHGRGAWKLYGGHRLWTTRPDADEGEETYAPDNRACRVRSLRDGVAVSARCEATMLEKTLAIRARPSGWRIDHRVRNVGDMLWAGGAWALTCTLPSARTRYRIPLPPPEPGWDAVTIVIPRRWGGGHTSRVPDRQFNLTSNAIEIRPAGGEAKRMFGLPIGTLEMVDPARGAFTKHAPRAAGGAYPLGANLAVYLGPARFMVELETMSPIARLAPGESLVHTEQWTLRSPP
jgi:hypothetical protein